MNLLMRRSIIPKSNGGQRPIGVPQVIDRAIQAGMAKILNEIYEQDFLPCSFGFRPKIGCHHALATINEVQYKWKLNHALEVDIRDFFGSLKHEWLRKFLGLRIGDKRVLKLIDAWLAAGVMEEEKWKESEDGTPQGGSISPILSNIYLHYVLDLWFERKIRKQLSGQAHLVRYADDFLILCKNKEDMENVKTLLIARLAQFGLSLAEEKTHMTDLTPRSNSGKDRRRISFLGFNILRVPNRNGTGTKTVFQTEGKRFTRAKAKIKEKMFRMMHADVEIQAKLINSMLIGHFNYYGIAGNLKHIQNFWDFTTRYWRRCLSRRSQNGTISWVKMEELLKKHPLIRPRIRIPYQVMNQYVRL
jgi:group II intron reverse transcriptase/maturase